MKVIIICGMIKETPIIDAPVIGVDYGALFCCEHGINMEMAIGDFDSIDSIEVIRPYCLNLIKLSTNKNETDSEAAIKYALEEGYDDVYLYGGLGGRVDHEYANLILLTQREYPLTIINEQNKMFCLENGKYQISKANYHYISFFAINKSLITLTNVKYPLEEREIDCSDIYLTSNEILTDKCEVVVNGKVLVIQSNDQKQNKNL